MWLEPEHHTSFCVSCCLCVWIFVIVSICSVTVPLADSFLVLMIFAAYSCPDDFFTHLRTTEKAPLGRKQHTQSRRKKTKKTNNFHDLPLTHAQSATSEMASTSSAGSGLFFAYADKLSCYQTHIHTRTRPEKKRVVLGYDS